MPHSSKELTEMGIPKGSIDRGDATEAALEEAHEEAGLQGRIVAETLGTYEYQKDVAALAVAVFVMEVRRPAA